MPPPDPAALAAAVVTAWRSSGRNPRELFKELWPAVLDTPVRAAAVRSANGAIALQRRFEARLGGASPRWRRLDGAQRDLAFAYAAQVHGGDAESAAASAAFAAATGLRLDFTAVRAVHAARAGGARVGAAEGADRTADFAMEHSLPDWLAAELLRELGDQAPALAAALNEPAPRTIRANPLRVPDRAALATELATQEIRTSPTARAPHGLVVHGDVDLFGLSAFRSGRFEQQDEGSQLVALLTAPPPRGKVLDLCAGSGGKTLALAAALGNRGEIVATDVHAGRRAELVRRARRAGVTNVRVLPIAEDGWTDTVAAFAARADRILIDAPCTGVGAWRRRPEARWALRPEDLPRLRAVQDALLDRAAGALAPGARLVYATCTVFAEENEQRVDALRARRPELEFVRAAEILGNELARPITDPSGTFLRLLPHVHGTDGFFAAVLRRRSSP